MRIVTARAGGPRSAGYNQRVAFSAPEVLRLLAVSQLLVLLSLLLRDHARDRSARASAFLLIGSSCHLIQPLVEQRAPGAPLLHLLVIAGLLVPAAFWLLARVHFNDDCCLRPWHWLAMATPVLAGYAAWLAPRAAAVGRALGDSASLVELGGQLGASALLALALLDVYIGARSDLVLSRLRLRYWILGLTGTYVLVERTALALAEGTRGEAAVDAAYAVSVCLLAFGILVATTLVQPGALRPTRAPAPLEPPSDPRLAEQLRRLVESEQVYREEGLTIAALAARLGAPETKVRQLVNAQLGFKNFNAFLHHYRLAEAQRALCDPARRHLTVSQVAFEVGYASLGPFNRAFKDATGVTPTEYRAAHLAPETPPAGSPISETASFSADLARQPASRSRA